MMRWWRLAIATWWANPGRTSAVTVSVALGVAVVVIVTNFFETARRALANDVVTPLMGAAHVSVHPVGAHWGSLDETFTDDIARLDNVEHVTGRLQRRARLVPSDQAEQLLEDSWLTVDAVGIDTDTSAPFLSLKNLSGRMFRSGEHAVAVVERPREQFPGLSLGDDVLITPFYGGPKVKLEVVGMFDSQRVADFQHPNVYLPLKDLQALEQTEHVVSVIDVMLHDPSPDRMAATAKSIEQAIKQRGFVYPVRVESAAARQMLLSEAERITRMLLLLTAFISMLTSFFIILTTQSVGLTQRRPQLGVMRCVGLTRSQLTAMLAMELIPLCIVGTILGLLGGLFVGFLIAGYAADIHLTIEVSPWCVYLSVASGLLTTLFSTALLIGQVGHVTPLEAVHTSARPVRMKYVWGASVLGLVCLAFHEWMALAGDRTQWLSTGYAVSGTGLLYMGYVLLVPGVVFLFGRPVARLMGRMLGVGARLTEDPFVRAPWRTTGACWVLMVGLSLIVYVAVRAQSILNIWDYPAQLPSAFVWSSDYVPSQTIEEVKRLAGVGKTTVSTDVPCVITTPDRPQPAKKNSLVESFLKKLTRPVFVAGDPDALLSMIKVAFTEGTREDAMPKLRHGGYVLVPPETARNKGLHVGDSVTVTVMDRSADFTVAGIVESPAMDLAVTAFQAQSYMQIAAASAILGTRTDLQEKFGLDSVSMFMCDIELKPATPPPGFSLETLPSTASDDLVASAVFRWRSYLPEERDAIDALQTAMSKRREQQESTGENNAEPTMRPQYIRDELQRFAKAIQRIQYSPRSKKRTAQQNWDSLRERLILLKIAQIMGRPDAIMGSLRRLKENVDRLLTRALTVMTWLPSILLVVAAIGIANLMMISVHQRTRQIAVLRAIGAQKSQILRLILAEAVTIGLLGSVAGIALGLHEADSANRIVREITDVTLAFILPFGTLLLGVLLTVGVCLLAALLPARYAARNNIIEAMQTA